MKLNIFLVRENIFLNVLFAQEKGNYLKMRDYSSNGELQLQSSFCNWIQFLLFSEQNLHRFFWFSESIEKILFLKTDANIFFSIPWLVSNAESMPSTFIIPDRKFVLDHQEHKSYIDKYYTLFVFIYHEGDAKQSVLGKIILTLWMLTNHTPLKSGKYYIIRSLIWSPPLWD